MCGVSLGQGLGTHRIGLTNKITCKQRFTQPEGKTGAWHSLSLSFLITQQHIGDPTADGEHTSRLWALQGALQDLHLQQHVVHLSQKFLVMLISLNRLFRHLDEMQLWARGLNHLGFPDARLEALSAASRSAAHSTFGIIRTMKSGLNSTGLIRTSVAWRRRGKPRGPTPRTCELSKLWVSSLMSALPRTLR